LIRFAVVDENNIVLPGQLKFFWDSDAEPQADVARLESGNDMAELKKLKKAAKASSAKEVRIKKNARKPLGPAIQAPAKNRKKASNRVAAPKSGAPISEAATILDELATPQTDDVETIVIEPEISESQVLEPAAAELVTPKPVTPEPAVKDPSVQSPSANSSPVNHADQVESFDMQWGAKLPKVGFGFWKVEKEKTAEVCRTAIEVGYRHLDCACDYGNEVEVGQGIAQAIKGGMCDREDLWVTSKLWNTYHAPEHVQLACEKSLQDLKLDYLDLYLIHFPIAQRFVPFEKNYPPGWFFNPNAANPTIEESRVPISETWQAMEELAKSGLVRNIGICNFGTSQIRDLLTYAHIRPAVLQVETHPYLTQEKLLRYCNQEKITYTAFSPLGAQSYFSLGMADPSEAVMANDAVKAIATETGKTIAQVLLRWGVQRGTAVIPKTSSKPRMIENIDVFNFELSDNQMAAISALDQGRRFNDPGYFGEAAFNTFLPIYE